MFFERRNFLKQTKNGKWKTFLKMLPLAFCIFLMIGYLLSDKEISAQILLEYTPANPVLAACALLLFYAVKSVSIIFPLMVIRITAGHLFPLGIALLINIAGMVICFTIPYWIGHFSGADTINSLKSKYPRLESLLNLQKNNVFFICFFLRIIGFLPGDIVSMYFGASGIPFIPYILGSLLGALPNTTTATFMGNSLTEPGSPMFLISVLITALLTGLSLFLHVFYKRKNSHKN